MSYHLMGFRSSPLGVVGTLLEIDRAQILGQVTLFERLFNSRVTILGGTGFVGSWIVESIEALNEEFSANVSLTLYSRDTSYAREKFQHIHTTSINYLELDLANSGDATLESSDFFIHGATPSIIRTGILNSEQGLRSTVRGAELIRDAAVRNPNKSIAMHLSSGAVYGRQPLSLKFQPEAELRGELMGVNSYASSKIQAERIIQELNQLENCVGINPRLFTFYGPGISLQDHFAVGNFMNDILQKRPITIQGSPETTRSYQYPTDMVISILAILARPQAGVINIGSDDPISMVDLAGQMCDTLGGLGSSLGNKESLPSNYVPEVNFLKANYRITNQVCLDDGLLRWHEWLLNK
jgi:nucleoside-diphosphate-sugar epimerase